jgi:hypothetical protein
MASRSLVRVAGLSVALLALATVSYAQSGFAGIVKDSSGAVLPGVTVEAASPALIERVRSAVTDNNGSYRIIDLRPGLYSVTFTLPGFATVKRDAIQLPAEFTATLSVELRVGALEETITVTGEAPVVDVANVLQQRVLTPDQVDAIPSSRSPQALALLTVGVTSNLGALAGSSGELSPAVHGGRGGEAQIRIDGDAAILTGYTGSGGQGLRFNQAYVQEISIKTGGAGADQATAGVVSNIIPREGGNRFSGSFFGSYTDEHMQANNLDADQIARGLTGVNRVIRVYDFTPAIGGPIKRDAVWFFGSARAFKSTNTFAGMFVDTDPIDWVYTPDLSRPATETVVIPDGNARVTWQISTKNKLSGFFQQNGYGQSSKGAGSTSTLETASRSRHVPNTLGQFAWKSPISSNVLLEAGATVFYFTRQLMPQKGLDESAIQVTEQSTGIRFRAPAPGDLGFLITKNYSEKASLTYVTGTQTFETGFTNTSGTNSERTYSGSHSIAYRFNNGVPNQIAQAAQPSQLDVKLDTMFALFAQDQWRLGRLTLNLGVRFDKLVAEALPTNLPEGDLVGPRVYDGVKNIPNYTDFSPRLGGAYNLTGDGRTALKGTLGRYNLADSTNNLTTALHPLTRSIASATRSWTDADRDYVADCDLRNPLANGECGQISNLNFGKQNPNATVYDDNVAKGFGVRAYNWYLSAEVQREITRGSSLTLGYYRRWYGNFTTTDNLAVTAADYDPFCVVAPVDARLPNGGGYQVCGLADIKPAKFGQSVINNVQTSKFGKRTEIYDGFDVNANVRVKGLTLNGGVNVGRTKSNNCIVIDSPQAMLNCETRPPFQPNSRLVASYRLPVWDIQTSAVFQMNPPPQITANYTASAAQIVGLGRPLSGGTNVTVPLIAPGTVYGDYVKQIDLRFSKLFAISRVKMRANLDVFNLMNANSPQALGNTFGPIWLRPSAVQQGRYAQVGGQIDF